MTTDPTQSALFTPDLAEKYARVLGAHPVFTSRPSIAAALANANATDNDLRIAGGFLHSLDLQKQVHLARSGGAKMAFSDEDRAYLSILGEALDDVDVAPAIKAEETRVARVTQATTPSQAEMSAGGGGFLGSVVHGGIGALKWGATQISHVSEIPGVGQGLDALGAAADATKGLVRTGTMLGAVGTASPGDLGESFVGAQQRGYDPGNPVSMLSYLSQGEKNYHSLADLREAHGAGAVSMAQQYLEHPEDFANLEGLSDDQIAARIQATNDPKFEELVTLVDARHMSAGRDVAHTIGLAPGSKPFTVVSGGLDAVESWYVDPTVIGGKLAQANKLRKLGIDSLVDEAGIRRVMRDNRQVRAGWLNLVSQSRVIREGTDAEKAAALVSVRSATPELVPLLQEVNGFRRVVVEGQLEFRQIAQPITTLEDMTEYLVTQNALVRTTRGLAPKRGVFMPGAVSRLGAAKARLAEKSALHSATSHEARIVDLSTEAAKVIPYPENAFLASDKIPSRRDLSLMGEQADGVPGLGPDAASVRGEAIAADRRTPRGRALVAAKRYSALMPDISKLDYYDSKATDQVLKWAQIYMPKSEARIIAAKFSASNLADRRELVKAMYEQTIHAAGLEASASGREIAKRLRGDMDLQDAQKYSLAKDADVISDDAGTRRVAVAPGQVDTELWLPSFAELQKGAAKVSLYDHTLRRVVDSDAMEKIMSTMRAGWLMTFSNAERNILDNLSNTAARGQLGATARAGTSMSVGKAMRSLERELVNPGDSANWLSQIKYHKARIGRPLNTLKASVLSNFTNTELDEAAEILATEVAQGHLGKLGWMPTGLVTGAVDPANLKDVAEITKAGFRPAEIAFRKWTHTWGEVAADGEHGARAWAINLDHYVAGHPELAKRLSAAVRQGPSDTELTKRMSGLDEVKQLAASSRKLRSAFDAQEGVTNKVADAVLQFGKDKGAAERWNRANSGLDLESPGALLEIRDSLIYLRERSLQTLDDPKLQRAAARHTPGARDAMEASKRQALTVLIDKTGSLDALIGKLDAHLASATEVAKAKQALRSSAKDRDFSGELSAHVAEHPEMARYREFAEVARGIREGATPELRKMAADDVADRMTRSFAALTTGRDGQPIHELLDRLEKGEVPSIDWLSRHVPTDRRPEHLIGRQWAPVQAEGSGIVGVGAMLGNAYTSALSRGYSALVSGPIAKLSTHPMFAANFVKARRNLAGYADNLVKGGLDREAAKLAETKLALDHALDMTSRMTDNPEVASQMATISRNLVNFPRAAEDWVRRWAQTIKEDPSRIRKIQMAFEGGQHSGVIDTDDQGNLIFTFPGSGAAINAFIRAGEALHIPGVVSIPTVPDLSSKVLYLNPSLDNPFFPGFSPVVTTPLKLAQGLFPESSLLMQDLQTIATGSERGASQGVLDQFMPTFARNFFKALTADEMDANLSSAAMNAVVHLDAAGLTPPPDATPDEREAFLARVRTAAKNQLVMRSIFAFALPASPSLPENDVAGTGKADLMFQGTGISSLKDEMRVLVGKLGFERALAVWTKVHPDELAYTVGRSSSNSPYGSVSPTRDAEEYIEANLDFVKGYSTIAAYFIPDTPGEFSPEAYRAQMEIGLRERKGLDKFYSDVRVINAERQYYAARDLRDKAIARAQATGDTEKVKSVKAGWSAWTQGDGKEPGFLNLNPLFAAKLANYGERTVQRQQAIAELDKMVTDSVFGDVTGSGAVDVIKLNRVGRMPANKETADGVAALLQAYKAHSAFTDKMRGRRDAEGLAMKDSEQRGYEKHMLAIVGGTYDADGKLQGSNHTLVDIYQGLFRGLD